MSQMVKRSHRTTLRFYSVWVVAVLAVSTTAYGQNGASDDNAQLWGGEGVSLRVTATGATLEFDCAHGAILQPIRPNADGTFSTSGTFTPEHGGPIQKNNPPSDLPATYHGSIQGDSMHLEIELTVKDYAPSSLALTRGAAGHLRKCR